MNDGKLFEKLTAEIFERLKANPAFETVEHNIKLQGVDCERQIDILLKGRIGPIEIMTIIECKDLNRMVTIEAVDALHSKMCDVKAQKAVLVASKGFSQNAKNKAKRIGITLCTAHEAKSLDWPFQAQLPFIVEEISCHSFELKFGFTAKATNHTVFFDRISGASTVKLIADYWNKNNIQEHEDSFTHIFQPDLPEPHWLMFDNYVRTYVTDLKIAMYVEKSYYFGYFNDLDSAKGLSFIHENSMRVLFNPQEIFEYRLKLSKFKKLKDIPSVTGVKIIRFKLLNNPKAIHDLESATIEPAKESNAGSS